MSVPALSNDVVLTVAESARLAKVSEWLIRQEIKAGNLRARRIGSCVRITRIEFDRWLGGEAEVTGSAEDATSGTDDSGSVNIGRPNHISVQRFPRELHGSGAPHDAPALQSKVKAYVEGGS